MPKVLYTAIISNYDRLFPVAADLRRGWELKCFTDQDLQSDCYQIVKVRPEGLPAVAMARRIKILSHEYLPDADISIWIDGSRRVVSSLDSFAASLEGADFVCIRHPNRDCVYREMDACLKYKKASPEGIAGQREEYLKMKIPPRLGLQHTGVLLRRKSPETSAVNSIWWELTKRFATWRDQLTLPVALYDLNYHPRMLPPMAIEKFSVQKTMHKGIYARAA